MNWKLHNGPLPCVYFVILSVKHHPIQENFSLKKDMHWLTFRDVYFNTVDIVVSAANDDVIVYSNRRWKYVPGKFEWTKDTTTPCTENIHIATCRAGTYAWNIVLRCAFWSVILDLDVVVTRSGVHLRIQFCSPFQSKVFIPAVDALVVGPWVYPRVVQCTAFHHATGWEHGLVCGRLSYLCITKQSVPPDIFLLVVHEVVSKWNHLVMRTFITAVALTCTKELVVSLSRPKVYDEITGGRVFPQPYGAPWSHYLPALHLSQWGTPCRLHTPRPPHRWEAGQEKKIPAWDRCIPTSLLMSSTRNRDANTVLNYVVYLLSVAYNMIYNSVYSAYTVLCETTLNCSVYSEHTTRG